nr:mitochondrial import inner membrane translocase subunit TIM44-2 [Tanacetum cinerariifolium]
MRERWETSDHPVVHKIQDINESVFKKTDAAMSFKEICRRDPYFSLPDLVYDVQEIVKPVLKAYNQGETEELEKYCSPEIVERCKAQHKICDMQGTFYDNKILHISEVEVREIKMMGDTPLIIVGVSNSRKGADLECSTDMHVHTLRFDGSLLLVSSLRANSLKVLIPPSLRSSLSPEQSAFISGRQILDGPLILNKIIDWYKKRKKKLMLFKVDFEKAFDSISWKYLDYMLHKMSFGSR